MEVNQNMARFLGGTESVWNEVREHEDEKNSFHANLES